MKKKIRVRSYKGCNEKERIKFLTEARNVLLVNERYTRVDIIEIIEGDKINIGYITKISGNVDLRRTEIDESQNYILIKRSYIYHLNGGKEEYITVLQFAGNCKCNSDILSSLKIPKGSDVEFIHQDPKNLILDRTLDTGVQIKYTFISKNDTRTCYKRTITSPIGLEIVSEKYIIFIK